MENLLKIQDIDIEILKTQKEVASLLTKKEEQDKYILSIREERDALKKKLQEEQKNNHSLELHLKSKSEELAKYNAQLLTIKTNKEYKAMLSEIDKVKEEVSAIEDDILRELERIEELEAKIQTKSRELTEEEKRQEKEKRRLEEELEDLREKEASFSQDRDEMTACIDPTLLALYDKIRNRKGGKAMAEVIDESCSGCNLQLPPQVVNEVIEGGKVILCQSCSRLLYWADKKED